MSFEQYLNVASQNVDWLTAIGHRGLPASIVHIHCEPPSQSFIASKKNWLGCRMTSLHFALAEEKRLFTELSPFNSDRAQEVRAAPTSEKDDEAPCAITEIRRGQSDEISP